MIDRIYHKSGSSMTQCEIRGGKDFKKGDDDEGEKG
jgi:hypothetical protein